MESKSPTYQPSKHCISVFENWLYLLVYLTFGRGSTQYWVRSLAEQG